MPFMKVLVAVKDEETGNLLADFITKHTWPPEVQFEVVHVIEPDRLHNIDPRFREEVLLRTEFEGDKLVKDIAGKLRHAPGCVLVETRVVHGDPEAQILNIAKAWGPDMVVIGHHRHRVRHSPCSEGLAISVAAASPSAVTIVPLSRTEPLASHEDKDEPVTPAHP